MVRIHPPRPNPFNSLGQFTAGSEAGLVAKLVAVEKSSSILAAASYYIWSTT